MKEQTFATKSIVSISIKLAVSSSIWRFIHAKHDLI
jgi:hypothetical protein